MPTKPIYNLDPQRPSRQQVMLPQAVTSVWVQLPQVANADNLSRCSARFYTPHKMHGGVIYGK